MAAVVRERDSEEKAPQSASIAVLTSLRERAWVVPFLRVLTAMGAWLLVGAHVFRPQWKQFGWPITLYLAVGIILFCGKVRGKAVYGRTPVDVGFVLWLGLAVASQLWGSMVLNRVLMSDDIQNYMIIILTSWMMFRAAFALCIVDPRTATGAFLKAILVCLGFACMIGVLQGYGPGGLKQWATNFGVENGAAGMVTELQLEMRSPRPLALFSGPNYFGFMNLIGMAIIIGMTAAQGRSMSTRSVWTAAFGMTLFMIGTIVAQSRFAILTCFFLLVYFMYLMFRTGRTQVVVTGIVATGCIVVAGLLFVQQMDLGYLESTFERKLSDDGSVRLRQRGIDALIDQSVDLAPLGAGFDSRGFSIDRTGDVWARTNSIDNGYLQAFINHGVPGVLHLAFMFWTCWWALRLAKRHPHLHIRTLRIIGGLLLATYMVYSLSGVRHAKLETSVYWMIIFGLIYASLYGEMWFGRKYMKAVQAPAAPAAS